LWALSGGNCADDAEEIAVSDPKTLPQSVIYDYDAVDTIIRAAALACASQLGVTSGWKDDNSWQSDLVWLASAVNPLSGIKNLIREGQWTQTTSGAQEVTVNTSRREFFKSDFYNTFWGYFRRCMAQDKGAGSQAVDYLNSLVARTRYAWSAVSEQFEMARRINRDVSVYLNDALDRAYRIRTAASIAFMVVGSLPVLTAAAGAATVASFTYTGAVAGSFTVVASTASPWVMAFQVAGTAAVYGFLTDVAFNKDEVRNSKVSGVHFGDGATSAAFGGGGNLVQAGVETVRARGAAKIAEEARLAANRESVRNAMLEARAAALGRAVNPSEMSNEIARRTAAGLAQHAEQRLNRVAQSVARSGSAIFICYGLYSMRDDIRTAVNGLTAEIDRTR
jgi:hypothetical protein